MKHTLEELRQMTQTEEGKHQLSGMVHKLLGRDKLFVLYRPARLGWYRVDGRGYTDSIESPDTWLLTQEQALTHTLYADSTPADGLMYEERVVMQPAPVKDYTGSLDAMREAWETLPSPQLFSYIVNLSKLVSEEPAMLHASPAEHAAAFVFTSAASVVSGSDRVIYVLVLGYGGDGVADVIGYQLLCTAEQFEQGEHYEKAKQFAEDDAGLDPFCAVDQEDQLFARIDYDWLAARRLRDIRS
jgi:hypothetical protein